MTCAGGFVLALCLGFATSALPGPPILCGDGVPEGAELCGDGNTVDGDGCSSTCLLE